MEVDLRAVECAVALINYVIQSHDHQEHFLRPSVAISQSSSLPMESSGLVDSST